MSQGPAASASSAYSAASAAPPVARAVLDASMVTTAFELPGYRVVRNYGVVRGIVVRSRSLFGTLGASLQTLVGGNITLFTELCEKTRTDAFALMMLHAAEHGANAVIGARYDANELMQGVTEVLAYGTAVWVERVG
jgi:uncharacterized protein YbjQ (UPF0145 family)